MRELEVTRYLPTSLAKFACQLQVFKIGQNMLPGAFSTTLEFRNYVRTNQLGVPYRIVMVQIQTAYVTAVIYQTRPVYGSRILDILSCAKIAAKKLGRSDHTNSEMVVRCPNPHSTSLSLIVHGSSSITVSKGRRLLWYDHKTSSAGSQKSLQVRDRAARVVACICALLVTSLNKSGAGSSSR